MHTTFDASAAWPVPNERPEPARRGTPPPLTDPIDAMVAADRADWALLRLILCTTVATLLVALAASLPL